MLEKTESQLIPEKQRLRQEATQQVSTLQQQAATLEQQLAGISSDIWQTEQDLQYMAIDLFNAQNLPPRLRPSLFYLQNQIRTAQLSLSALRSNGNQISNQLRVLSAQIRQTQNVFNQQIRELDKEIKRVSGAKRRNLARLARLAGGPEVADGKRAAMQNKITALSTYDEFPLLLYRQELLEKLSDK
jgi:septal ring factor EnvC (AmiA/AmiB activator)